MGRAAIGRRVLGALVAAGLLAGCGAGDPVASDSRSTAGGSAPGTGSSKGTPSADAGTPIADGLTVPAGARPAGGVFRGPVENRQAIDAADGWLAVLAIEDPFAAYDAVAAQLRAQGMAVPGSAAACSWVLPTADPDHARLVPVTGDDPGDVAALTCRAGASDGRREARLELAWGGRSTGTLVVAAGHPETAAAAGSWAGAHEEPAAGLGTEPVPAGAGQHLPDPAPSDIAPGERFGGEGNCFASGGERGHRAFALPEGALLLAADGSGSGVSVLATEDIAATIRALRDQAQPRNQEVDDQVTVTLPDGTEVAWTTWSVWAGGGGCTLIGAPDGHSLLVSMTSD